MDQCQRGPLVPEEILPAPKRTCTPKQLLKLWVAAQCHLATFQVQQQKNQQGHKPEVSAGRLPAGRLPCGTLAWCSADLGQQQDLAASNDMLLIRG